MIIKAAFVKGIIYDLKMQGAGNFTFGLPLKYTFETNFEKSELMVRKGHSLGQMGPNTNHNQMRNLMP